MPMSGRIVTAFSLIVLALGLAGCGGGDGDETTTFDTDTTITNTETTETTTSTASETTKLRVYFLLDGKVQPVAREVAKTPAVGAAALDELAAGPSASEEDIGLTSDVASPLPPIVIEKGVARLSGGSKLSPEGRAQVVYTLTQFPTVKAVEIDGKRYTRKSMEDFTPAILVESPLPFATVSSPVRATGTANTFEANFNYELIDPAGKVIDENFVTATSGTGTRGTFDFTTKPYAGEAGEGELVVLEFSAKDGSRIHEVRIPLQLEP